MSVIMRKTATASSRWERKGGSQALGSLTFQDLSHNFCSRSSPTCVQQERIKPPVTKRGEVLPKITPPLGARTETRFSARIKD